METENDKDEPEQVENAHTQKTGTQRKERPPPPIICMGKPADHAGLVREIKAKIKKGFHLQYTSKSVSIFIHDLVEWRMLKGEFDEIGIPFYSYTHTSEKEHSFIIRGLDNEPATSELQETLEEDHNMSVHKRFKLTTKGRSLYMITTTKDYTIRRLNAEIKYINHTKVSWERRNSSERQIIQCHRCQSWGHATSNCRMPPRCLKCASPHLTHECKKKPDTPAKCANCDKDHPANYTGCEAYVKKLEVLHKPIERTTSSET